MLALAPFSVLLKSMNSVEIRNLAAYINFRKTVKRRKWLRKRASI